MYTYIYAQVEINKNKDDHRPQERSSNLFSLGNKQMILKKKTLKKNLSNRKPISYSTEFRLDINLNNFVRKLCPAMINAFLLYIPCIYKRDYSTGRNNGSLIQKNIQLLGHSLCLSVSLSLCPSVSLSLCLSVPLSLCLSASLSLCLSVSLSLCLSLSVSLSLCLSVSLSLRLSASQSVIGGFGGMGVVRGSYPLAVKLLRIRN